jgi:Flp pilus assembly protein TadB
VPGKISSSAGAVIADALMRARAEGTSQIGEEHLFADALAARGITLAAAPEAMQADDPQ